MTRYSLCEYELVHELVKLAEHGQMYVLRYNIVFRLVPPILRRKIKFFPELQKSGLCSTGKIFINLLLQRYFWTNEEKMINS